MILIYGTRKKCNKEKTEAILNSNSQGKIICQYLLTRMQDRTVAQREIIDFWNVAKLKYFGTKAANTNITLEEIKNRFSFGNFCYHSFRNVLVSLFPSKKLNIRMYKTKVWNRNLVPRVKGIT
jgi:hypothetical protein